MRLAVQKTPTARRQLVLHYDQLVGDADALDAASVSVTPDGLTVEDPTILSDTTLAAWVEGGTAGTDYFVVFHVTTDGSAEDETCVKVRVRSAC